MLVFTQLCRPCQSKTPDAVVVLTFDQRQKTRARHALAQGCIDQQHEIGIDLPRGTLLRHGDGLYSDSGGTVLVQAAIEQLLEVRVSQKDPEQAACALARIAYHLGNRHVAVQVGIGFLRLELDHVLEEMVHGLGGTTAVINAMFDPETGAYAAHASPGHTTHASSYADSDHDPERFRNHRHAPKIHDFTQNPLAQLKT